MFKQTAIKYLFPAALTIFLLSGANTGVPAGPAKLHAAPTPSDGVIVYQFHRRFRCDACYKLEAAINEALKTHFQEDIETGKLVYRVLDLDAEGSNAYEKKYDFFYNTVIVVDIENGKETRFKNLEEVWELVDDKDAAMEFIRSHVSEYL
jgi:hypothetical protein